MAVIDRIKTTPGLGSLNFQTSILDGLVGLYQPRKSDLDIGVNRAPGGVDAVLHGSPAYTLWGAELGPDAWLDTVHPETEEFSIITIARKQSVVGGVALVSTQVGSASTTPCVTTSLRDATSQAARYQADVKTAPDTAVQTLGYDFPVDDDGFEFMATSCSATEIINFLPRNPSPVVGGNPRTVTLSGTRDANDETWRIGWIKAVSSALFPGSTEHALEMIYDRPLTVLEMRAIYAEALPYFVPRGVAI